MNRNKWALVPILLGLLLTSGCSFCRRVADLLGVEPETLSPDDSLSVVASSMPWVVLVCLAGIGLSVFLLMQGNKLGVASGVAFVATMVLAIAISKHLALIAWIGTGALVALATFFGWRVWVNRSKLTVKTEELKVEHTALVEAVATTECAKDELDIDSRNIVFGKPDIDDHGAAGRIQSPATEKIIAKIRGK